MKLVRKYIDKDGAGLVASHFGTIRNQKWLIYFSIFLGKSHLSPRTLKTCGMPII